MRKLLAVAVVAMGFSVLAGSPAKKVVAKANTPAPPAINVPSSEALDKDVVDLAVSSKDHSTLVAAVKAADYVDSLKNPGPFTVFAPTNDAFAKLPKGTLETLMKPENQAQLQKVLQHHVTPANQPLAFLTDGSKLGQVDGKSVEVHVKDGKVMIGTATILAQVKVSNGIVYVIDQVLVP